MGLSHAMVLLFELFLTQEEATGKARKLVQSAYFWSEFPHQSNIAQSISERFVAVFVDIEFLTSLRLMAGYMNMIACIIAFQRLKMLC